MNEQPSDDIRALLDLELDASDDSDEDIIHESDHNTDSEQSDGENTEEEDFPLPRNIVLPQEEPAERVEVNQHVQIVRENLYNEQNSNDLYVAKDGTRWRMIPKRRNTARRRPCDIVRTLPGVRNEARQADSPIKSFQLFFNDAILEEIVTYTNIYIQSIRHKYARERDAADTNLPELKACLGLLFMGGVMKVSHTNLEDLWRNDGTGIEIFRLTMGINRFRFLLKCIRFDDINTRDVRKRTDKLAPVRSILDEFNRNCQKHYSLSQYVTIDEMLDAFRGRCSFRQYIPNKPAKYGIKIFALTDAKMFYTSNVEIYCGKQPEGPYLVDNDSHSIVKRLIEPITNSGRNVTCDNWFVSIQLAQDLLHNHKLTLVGTVNKKRKGIPAFMKTPKNRPIESTIFAFKENMTLVSYKPKNNKIVLALSTLHPEEDKVVENEETGKCKSDIILAYNSTKSGVDVVDEMKCSYNVSRITRRWTLVVFFSFLNISGINAYVIHKSNTGSQSERKEFLRSLSKELLNDYLRLKVQQRNLQTTVKLRISEILGHRPMIEQVAAPRNPGQGRGRCSFCDRKKNRPTRFHCKACSKYLCMEHISAYLCGQCSERGVFTNEDDAMDED